MDSRILSASTARLSSWMEKGDLVNYLKTDFVFHEIMYRRQHNKYMTSVMDSYMLIIHFVRYYSMGSEEEFEATAKESIKWHRYILEAVRERDEEESVKRLREHLAIHKKEAVIFTDNE